MKIPSDRTHPHVIKPSTALHPIQSGKVKPNAPSACDNNANRVQSYFNYSHSNEREAIYK